MGGNERFPPTPGPGRGAKSLTHSLPHTWLLQGPVSGEAERWGCWAKKVLGPSFQETWRVATPRQTSGTWAPVGEATGCQKGHGPAAGTLRWPRGL